MSRTVELAASTVEPPVRPRLDGPARRGVDMVGGPEGAYRRRHATIQTAHVLTAGPPGPVLRIAVSAEGPEPRITVVAHDAGTVTTGGLIGLRDVRRIARAVTRRSGGRTSIPLRPWGELPGGGVSVERAGDDVYVVATPPEGRSTRFEPVPVVMVSAMCRDVVSWSRLLSRAASSRSGP